MKHNGTKTPTYFTPTLLRHNDITKLYKKAFGYHNGRMYLNLVDFTCNGKNIDSLNPAYMKYFSEKPFRVTIKDEDDFYLEAFFNSMKQAWAFFDAFLINPQEKIKEMSV